MRKRNWTLFSVLTALAALAALSIGGVGSAVAASASASAASASGGEKATAARRRGRRGPRGRRGRRGPAGATGPVGPQGPPGTTTGGGVVTGGWGKVFFAANGVAPTSTLIDINGFTYQSQCDGADQNPEFRTSYDNSAIRAGVWNDEGIGPFGPDEHSQLFTDDDFDIGETFGEVTDQSFDDNSIIDFKMANPVGTLVMANLAVEDDPNSIFVSTDCTIWGGYYAA